MPADLHDPKPGECYVNSLAVLPESRGKGVGTKLLKWAEEKARERKCTRMCLGVLSGNPAKVRKMAYQRKWSREVASSK